jgi:hypothetical protein
MFRKAKFLAVFWGAVILLAGLLRRADAQIKLSHGLGPWPAEAQWFGVDSSLPADRAWAALKKTAVKELGFDILIQDKDYFQTDWLRDGARPIRFRLYVLRDEEKPFSALVSVDADVSVGESGKKNSGMIARAIKDYARLVAGAYTIGMSEVILHNRQKKANALMQGFAREYRNRVYLVMTEALAAGGEVFPPSPLSDAPSIPSSPSSQAGSRRPGQPTALAAIQPLLKSGDYDAARSRLEAVLKDSAAADPRRIGVYRMLGTIAYRKRDRDAAQVFFLKGIRLAEKLKVSGPDAAACFLGMADCLKAKGDKENAVKNLHKALLAGPDMSLTRKIRRRLRSLAE